MSSLQELSSISKLLDSGTHFRHLSDSSDHWRFAQALQPLPTTFTSCELLSVNTMAARPNSSLTLRLHSRRTSSFLKAGVFTIERMVTPESSSFSIPRTAG